MDEALRELQTTKFWILSVVGIFISIFANFATDWVKFVFKAAHEKYSLENFSAFHARANGFVVAICFVFSMQSLLFLNIGYYWTARLLAIVIALYFSIDIFETMQKYIPGDVGNRSSFIVSKVLTAFAIIWVAFFGAANLVHWMAKMGYITTAQAVIILAISYFFYWVANFFRSEIKKDPQAEDA